MGLSKKVIISELYQLVHPYYWINLILCLSFLGLKLISPFCEILFGPGAESCELDMRENEILFFLLIIVMVKSRKSGATHSAAAYLASGFIYAKVSLTCFFHLNKSVIWVPILYFLFQFANLILFFRADPRMGLIYLVA